MSIRRACSNLLLDTSTFHYHSRRPDQAALKERIKEICETRVRYGYRRVHVILRREGWFVNQKKVRRLYNEWACSYATVKRQRAMGSSAALNAEAEGAGQAHPRSSESCLAA